jgi:hypothetical protein
MIERWIQRLPLQKQLTYLWIPALAVALNIIGILIALTDETQRAFCETHIWTMTFDTIFVTPVSSAVASQWSARFYDFLAARRYWAEHPTHLIVVSGFCTFSTWCAITIPIQGLEYGFDMLFEDFFSKISFLILFVGVIAFQAAYTSIIYFERWKHSQQEAAELKRRATEAELTTLKAQLDPHFLFNSLNTLAALVEENPKQAQEFIQKFSQSYRYVLQSREKTVVTLREELQFAETYFYLLQQRFGANVSLNIDVPNQMLSFGVAPMSLQLLIENAVKHNIVSHEKPLCIDITGVDGRLVVKNNLQLKMSVEPSTGVGLKNIVSRNALLAPQRDVVIEQRDAKFSVTLPMIPMD